MPEEIEIFAIDKKILCEQDAELNPEEDLDTNGYERDSIQGLNSISLESPQSPTNLSEKEILNAASSKCSPSFFTRLVEWKPNSRLYNAAIYILTPISVWMVAYLVVGPIALPNGSLFPLIVLEFCGIGLGLAMATIKLPPLLGMLTMGILIRNVPLIDFGKNLTPAISAPLRQIALVVILIRAGLGLDPEALVRLKGTVVRLAFCPCLCEAVAVAIASHILLGLPWAWGFLLGFVLAAVSPAVVVPCLLSLKERGFGVKKGIPTIIIAAASIDDILAISLFGVALGMALSQGSLTEAFIQGPIELILGIGFGLIWGLVMGVIFVKNDKGNRSVIVVRAFFLLSGGIVSIFGFQYLKYPGAGALSCLGSTVVSSAIWRRKKIFADGDNLCWVFEFLWFLFQPLLFGLIGCEIELGSMNGRVAGLGILCLCIGLLVRLLVSYVAVSKSNLNVYEKLFVGIAWLPKATVQAAIGSVALDTSRKIGAGPESEKLGLTILTIAVLSILLTAPLGATAIMVFGPKLLEKVDRRSSLSGNNHNSNQHI